MRLAVHPVGFPKTKMQQGKWHHAAIFEDEKIARDFCHEWFTETLDYDPDLWSSMVIPRSEIESMVDDPECVDFLVALMKPKMFIPFKELWYTPKGYFLVREF